MPHSIEMCEFFAMTRRDRSRAERRWPDDVGILDRYDIPYWDLCFMKDKAAVGADLYIDDSPDNVRKLRAGNHETIIFTNSTNRDVQGLRADNWAEVEKIVLNQMEEWKSQSSDGGLSGR